MATKVEKASRKLRKERKNRAKKVCLIIYTYSSFASDLLSSAPWYQKSQGCRASQEGQVDDGPHLCLLAFVVSMHTMLIPRSYAYASPPSSLCIAYRISIPKTWSTLKFLSKNEAANRVVYGYLNILRLRKEDKD